MKLDAKWTMTSVVDNVVNRTSGTSNSVADNPSIENHVVQVFPDVTYQTFSGFGGAFTESVGAVLSRMPINQANAILEDYYGPGGLGYVWGRIHIDSCDFSLTPYSSLTYSEAGTLIDPKVFGEHDQRYILPYVHQAQALLHNQQKGDLHLCLVPWSPPAHMKNNASRSGGGKLLAEHRNSWAEYLCLTVKEYQRQGLHIAFLGVQNEPNALQTWDSCEYSPQEEHDFVTDHLAPQLIAHGLPSVKISIWDHNKDRMFDRTRQVYRDDVKNAIGAVAFHWYSGDHFESIALIRDMYPELFLIFTEACIEYKHFCPASQLEHALRYAHQIMGDINHGAHAWIDWNLALDTSGGPNHVGNFCDAPILCDTDRGTYEKRASYWFIKHFSAYIHPGAVRLAFSRYTDSLGITAWKNPDESIALVALNETDRNIPFLLRMEGRVYPCSVDAESVMTLTIQG